MDHAVVHDLSYSSKHPWLHPSLFPAEQLLDGRRGEREEGVESGGHDSRGGGRDSLQSGSSDVTPETARGEVSGVGDASPVFIRNHLHRFS